MEELKMVDRRIAVVGLGATGSVLAAALLRKYPETILVDPATGLGEKILKNGINISGEISFSSVPVKNVYNRLQDITEPVPDLIFVCTKAFIFPKVLDELEPLFKPGIKIISTQNGLGMEDLIAEKFGVDSALRMILNYGVEVKGPGEIEATFFNRPNHIGSLSPDNRQIGEEIAHLLTNEGLDTDYVEDIKLFVWKKMIMKCTTSIITAITDQSLKEIVDFPPTRELADACFKEALSVAKAEGYDLGEGYISGALEYLSHAGNHKDSICQDVTNRRRTENDYLGAKVVEYGRKKGVSTPYYIALTNMVKAIEHRYLEKKSHS